MQDMEVAGVLIYKKRKPALLKGTGFSSQRELKKMRFIL